MTATTDWIQTGILVFTMGFTVWSARQQTKFRHADLEESARRNRQEHERTESVRRLQMRFQLAGQKRARLVANYPKWVIAVNDYVNAKHAEAHHRTMREELASYAAHQALLAAMIAVVLDESNPETAKVESLQRRLQGWDGNDIEVGRALARECVGHVQEKLVQWKNYRDPAPDAGTNSTSNLNAN